MNKIIIGFVSVLLVTGCGAKHSPKVSAMKPYDKALTCEEIALEMNEAEYVKNLASDNRSSLLNVFRPLGYIGTVSSANQSINASNSRIDYLSSIYQIKRCDDPAVAASQPRMTPADYMSEEAQLRRPFTSSL